MSKDLAKEEKKLRKNFQKKKEEEEEEEVRKYICICKCRIGLKPIESA